MCYASSILALPIDVYVQIGVIICVNFVKINLKREISLLKIDMTLNYKLMGICFMLGAVVEEEWLQKSTIALSVAEI